ncbi:MAG: flagellar hook-associated protein FlgK [Clostridiales bacterium GWE2_32_10]|nr:MAG: flagellar hook-associated protein FlgK [Clostridiales bacterium GWE2_32_10]HBY19695.1 flagellar hook-associated protein FlgK [Clostridiales bacterium]
MRSSFLEFNIAASGLFASQTALNIVSNNISNANTAGYSKQVVKQQATMPLSSSNGSGMVGTGTEVLGIEQIRDLYLDTKYWSQNSKLGETGVKNEMLTKIQMLFNEPSDYGINTTLNNFFNSLEDLSKDTSDESYYSSVKEAAMSLVSFFNETSNSLTAYQDELNGEVKIKVDQINSIASQIKSLNEQIYKFEVDGSTANDLRDQRALLVDDLSKIVDVEVEEVEINSNLKNGVYNATDKSKSDKHYVVKINGQILVNHFDANELEVAPRKYKSNPEDTKGLYNIKWDTGLPLNTQGLGGELKACLDLRDGNNGNIFTGGVGSVDLINKRVTVGSISRADIQNEGILRIGSKDMEYSSYTYDETTNQITFQLLDTTGIIVGDNVSIGSENDYKGIPHYINKLNKFVRTFASAFNEGTYSDGTKIDGLTGNVGGYSADGSTGNYIFTYNKTGKGTFTDYNDITAANFSLSKEFIDNSRVIATSTKADSGESDNEIINQFLTIKDNGSLFKEGKVLDFVASIIGEMAVDAKYSENYQDIQTSIVNTITNQRLSTSGVDLNEEMTSMVRYQSAYNAAARMITVIDEIYDTTINNMGARG